jgi:hypothetical protein
LATEPAAPNSESSGWAVITIISDFLNNLDHPFVYFYIENPVISVRNRKEKTGTIKSKKVRRWEGKKVGTS